MKDIQKRKRVMQRSMRLGHCICDPKKPCPCPVFTQQDVCLCAGERLPVSEEPVRLTRMVESAGCGSKIDQVTLRRVLDGLPVRDDPRVLIGAPAGDDAGVFLTDDGRALVQTVDVFAPSVDDPYTFGQIAAANSLSDVYAMGGRPLTALSIVGFPSRTVDERVMHDILRGGLDKMAEAGVPVIGGHSIRDENIKAGFAVTGEIDPDRIVSNAGAEPGDVLILTKPLGVGIIAFAAQIDRAPAGSAEAAAESMAALNRDAAEVMLEVGAHACTDVTGFALMGHLGAMAEASGVDVGIVWDDLPLLPGVLECTAQGIASGGVERNRESAGHRLDAGDGVTAGMLDICFDPQTSGGLLIAVGAERAAVLLARLHEVGVTAATVIGRVTGEGAGRIQVTTRGERTIPLATDAQAPAKSLQAEPATAACCADAPPPEDAACCADAAPSPTGAGIDAIRGKFVSFLQQANAPGAVDAYTKRMMAITLSVLSKCEPCVKIHIEKAREMGISQEEIDEAAWLAVSFGGSPIMMFYNAVRDA
jgi:selenide, water dikinase